MNNKFFLHLSAVVPYNGWRYGGLLKRSKRSHSKCDRPLIPARGFESHVLRRHYRLLDDNQFLLCKNDCFSILCNQNATKIQNIFAKCLFSFACSFFSTSVRVDL